MFRKSAPSNPSVASIQRERLSLTSSVKRQRDSDEEDDCKIVAGGNPWEFQRHERRKMMRSDKYVDNVATHSSSSNPTSRSSGAPRKPEVWGKMETQPNSGFGGKPFIPEVFLYRCSASSDPENVKQFLTDRGIEVTSVEIMSHADSFNKSFRVKVGTQKAYDTLLTGECLPQNVGVKRFRYPRRDSGDRRGNRKDSGDPRVQYYNEWQSKALDQLIDSPLRRPSPPSPNTGGTGTSEMDTAIAASVTDNLMTASQLVDKA